jgi:hypothetical protein
MKLASPAVLLAAASLLAAGARADTFTVTSLADDGNGTLRDAVAQAWSTPGADTIVFHPSLSGTIHLVSEIQVHGSLTIIGNASRVISIDGTDSGTAFRLALPTTEFGMIDLEVRNSASAIFIPDSGMTLNLQRCVFRDNGADAIEAGVLNAHYAGRSLTGTIQSCSFIHNRGNYAGVTINTPSPDGRPLNFINCTFVDNHSMHGAAVVLITSNSEEGQGMTNFLSCTITNNSSGEANWPAATIQVNGTIPALRVRNCIMTENVAADPAVDPNISGDNGEATLIEGAYLDGDAALGPLTVKNNLYVRVPLPGSGCIDAAYPDPDVRADQLGQVRPFVAPAATPPPWSDGSDVGAVEYVPASCRADFNGDGVANSQDFFDFLTAFFTGC